MAFRYPDFCDGQGRTEELRIVVVGCRWGTVYATQNLTAKEHFDGWDEDGLDHTGSVPAVSWWKVGKVISYVLEQIFVIKVIHDTAQRKQFEVQYIIYRMSWACRSGQVVSLWTRTPWSR